MVQFTSLRLTGFKSFVEPTQLEISPGLTGIVGPNGCGKSNLLEAIRWCMGEGSAKKMRGDGMDDVIFSGTGTRPARNIAEVALKLDNHMREAPSAFNHADELEVIRRIEREQGSAYSINGNETRARDVQLLFADLSTGAKSTAIVSQGRVASVISAKPQDRRQLIEEAAGITGLHSRRHEAELRLKAAETNLERLEDVIVALEGQMQNLKRQARQATRYKNLSGHVRRAEAMVLHLRWAATLAALDAAQTALRENASQVAEFTSAAAQAATAQAEAAGVLPDLRTKEAEAAAALQRLIVERESLEAEENRIKARQAEYQSALSQIDGDLTRERSFLEEAQAAQNRLEQEAAQLNDAQAGDADARAEADLQVTSLLDEVQTLEQGFAQMTHKVAAEEARRSDLDRRIGELDQRIALATRQSEEAAEEAASLKDQPVTLEADAAQEAVEQAEAAVTAAQAAADHADDAKAAAEIVEAEATRKKTAVEEDVTRLTAEIDALEAVIIRPGEEEYAAVLGDVSVTPGYEAALGAALGDDLDYSTDPAAPGAWQGTQLLDAPDLPAGCQALSTVVRGPTQLHRRLGQIAVAPDGADLQMLAGQLRQGQRLVSKTGEMWRWDGLHLKPGAQTAAETRLRQRNRLQDAMRELSAANTRLEETATAHAAARQTAETATESARAQATALRGQLVNLSQARERLDQATRAAAEQRSRLKILEAAVARLGTEKSEAETKLGEARIERAALASGESERQQLSQARDDLAQRRTDLGDAQQVQNRLVAEAQGRNHRLAAISTEVADWQRRSTNGQSHIDQLAERRTRTTEELAALDAMPGEITARRQALLTQVSEAEARRQDAADALALGENTLKACDETLRAAEGRLADMREEKGRCEGAVAQAEQALATVIEQVKEKLDCAPEDTLDVAEHKPGTDLPALDDMERKLERLLRERENMGPVNLRAEQEAEELQEQIDTYTTEREDLLNAIEKFRRAIADLNREGKQRLLVSFNKVNDHFQDLFTRLFGGGSAHLQLTDMDDPLNAGIEILASPPGKKLQHLSLLSGGEQALTALSLLFAVFLTNPAPICVLDEVDAPLDDSNVDRFCTLVQEIAERTDTRFLVVTHHRMTMARVDRLYGVTMAERGVSQLVSVDLEEAVELRATA